MLWLNSLKKIHVSILFFVPKRNIEIIMYHSILSEKNHGNIFKWTGGLNYIVLSSILAPNIELLSQRKTIAFKSQVFLKGNLLINGSHLGGLSDGFSRSIKLGLELFLSKLAGNQISQEHFTFYDYFTVYRLHCVGTKILITGSLFFPCIISLFSVKSNPQK